MASTSQQLFGEDSSDDEDVGSYFVLDRDGDGPPRFGRAFLAHRALTGPGADYEADDPAPARSIASLGRRILAAETLEELGCTRGRRWRRSAAARQTEGRRRARRGPSGASGRGRRLKFASGPRRAGR